MMLYSMFYATLYVHTITFAASKQLYNNDLILR